MVRCGEGPFYGNKVWVHLYGAGATGPPWPYGERSRRNGGMGGEREYLDGWGGAQVRDRNIIESMSSAPFHCVVIVLRASESV